MHGDDEMTYHTGSLGRDLILEPENRLFLVPAKNTPGGLGDHAKRTIARVLHEELFNLFSTCFKLIGSDMCLFEHIRMVFAWPAAFCCLIFL